MHTYIKCKGEQSLWTVGHYRMEGYEDTSSDHRWMAMKDFSTEEEAARYVNYLNGGNGNVF